MTVLVDDSKAVEITIREWDEVGVQYGPDWSNDFFEVGALRDVDGLDDAYWVDDVDYCIEEAIDMAGGVGGFAGDGAELSQFVVVTVLDRSEILRSVAE